MSSRFVHKERRRRVMGLLIANDVERMRTLAMCTFAEASIGSLQWSGRAGRAVLRLPTVLVRILVHCPGNIAKEPAAQLSDCHSAG